MDQEPSYTSEQDGEPTNALIVDLIVPEDAVEKAMDSLNRLHPPVTGGKPAVKRGTYCHYTGHPRMTIPARTLVNDGALMQGDGIRVHVVAPRSIRSGQI